MSQPQARAWRSHATSCRFASPGQVHVAERSLEIRFGEREARVPALKFKDSRARLARDVSPIAATPGRKNARSAAAARRAIGPAFRRPSPRR